MLPSFGRLLLQARQQGVILLPFPHLFRRSIASFVVAEPAFLYVQHVGTVGAEWRVRLLRTRRREQAAGHIDQILRHLGYRFRTGRQCITNGLSS